jgi:hypothetical protein
MVESHVVASTWSTAAQMCFLLAWIMAIWIASRIAPRIGALNRSIARAMGTAVSLLVILIAWMQMRYIVSSSVGFSMMQELRASSHLPPLAGTQVMKLGIDTYWSIWLLICLAIGCSALQIADCVLRSRYTRTLGLIYGGFFLAWLTGIGLIGAAAWLNQRSPVLLRSSMWTIVVLEAVSGIAVMVYFIIIHRQRIAA